MLDTVLLARDKYLAPGGKLFPDKASIHMAAIEDQEYKEEKINFWDNVYGFDFSPIKEVALREPLVDTVDFKAVVTDPFLLKEFDLATVTKEELSFKAPFTLKATRDDNIHAFLAWFDVSFSACHKPVKFSTGPHSQYTHWKQTVFYTIDPIAVFSGDLIQGTLTCSPNARNNRDLDIVIEYRLDTSSTDGNSEREVNDKIEYKMY